MDMMSELTQLFMYSFLNFWQVYTFVAIVSIFFVRYILSRPNTKIVYFQKAEVEVISSKETVESVAGKSKIKKDLVIFLKSDNVTPIIFRTFGMLYRLWIAIEDYPYLVNMSKLQDIAKKDINEEFLALFKKNTLPDIVGKVLRGEIYSRIFDILMGIPIGIVLGFVIMPIFLQYLGFL